MDRERIIDISYFAPHGFIALEKIGGSDLDVVNAARTSYDAQSSSMTDRDAGLINYLMRERHGTPFEQVELWFRGRAPIFVIREWVRHRVAEFNEESGRYHELKHEFWIPEADAVRTRVGKPGHYEYVPMDPDTAASVRVLLCNQNQSAFNTYKQLIDMDVALEVARTCLPVSVYSTFVWKCNLRAFLNFIGLRNATTAQREIREYAACMEEMVRPHLPVTMASFDKNERVAP